MKYQCDCGLTSGCAKCNPAMKIALYSKPDDTREKWNTVLNTLAALHEAFHNELNYRNKLKELMSAYDAWLE